MLQIQSSEYYSRAHAFIGSAKHRKCSKLPVFCVHVSQVLFKTSFILLGYDNANYLADVINNAAGQKFCSKKVYNMRVALKHALKELVDVQT